MRAKAVLASGLMVVLAGCSERAAEVSAQWGCGQVDGLKQIAGPKAPAYILVGEFTETSEAPAAFAEIACNLAARQGDDDGPLFVGLMEYVGGATDAETKVRARLDEVIARGAPIVVGTLGGEEHPFTVHNRSAAEAKWAKVIEAKVGAAGASRALLLLPRVDAIAEPIAPTGDRFAGYAPMATHLPEGQVIALEIANAPVKELTAPAIRIYSATTGGFHGQVALASLTRPAVEAVVAEARVTQNSWPAGVRINHAEMLALLKPEMNRQQRVDVLTDYFEKTVPAQPDDSQSLDLRRRIARSMAEAAARSSLTVFPIPADPAPLPLEAAPARADAPEPQVDLPEFEIEN